MLGARTTSILALTLAVASFVLLNVFAPPLPVLWRMIGLCPVGVSAALLGTTTLLVLGRQNPAVRGAAVLFYVGCALSALLAAVSPAAIAIIPAAALLIPLHANPKPLPRGPGLRVIVSGLLGGLFFFHFGSEWAIAGWLPLFLIRTFGAPPTCAVAALAAYFALLAVCVFAARRILRHAPRSRVMAAGVTASLAGCYVMGSAESLTVALSGMVLTTAGLGFTSSSVFGLVEERFPNDLQVYNRLLAVAGMGAFLAPWLLSYVDLWAGMRYIFVVPAFGSIAVLILARLLSLEKKLMGDETLSVASESV